jgi:hypothetical protein
MDAMSSVTSSSITTPSDLGNNPAVPLNNDVTAKKRNKSPALTKYKQKLESGTYVSLKPTHSSSTILESIINVSKIEDPLSIEDYHMTLVYSKEDGNTEYLDSDPSKVFTAEVIGVSPLGRGLVFLLNSPDELVNRFKSIQEKTNLKHSFPSMKPHITAKYDPVEGDYDKLKLAYETYIEMTGKPVIVKLTHESFETLKD